MAYLFLDIDIIKKFPKTLGLEIPNTNLLIPHSVADSIRKKGLGGTFKEKILIILLNDAIEAKLVLEVFKLPDGQSYGSAEIFDIAIQFFKDGWEVKVASINSNAKSITAGTNIDILGFTEIKGLIKTYEKETEVKSEIYKRLSSYSENRTVRAIKSVIFSLVIFTFFNFLVSNFQEIIDNVNVWGIISMILLSGIALFLFRQKFRLSYGILEFLFGAYTIIGLFTINNFNLSKITLDEQFYIRLAGGLYIMVRGQDNIVKAFKGTKLGKRLKKIGIDE